VMDMDFVVDGKSVDVKMRGKIAVNDAEAYIACGVKGVGIVQIPRFMALPHLRSGELIEVLPQWKPLPMPISVVYPHNRHLSPKVRVFVDWAAELFERCPLLSGQEDAEQRCLPTATPAKSIVKHGTPDVAGTAEVVV
jgi:LysR family transcriptional regulator, regulator for bpeEF and oprC